MDIRSDRQKGMSYTDIARKYHIDPRTAKRYAESPQPPEYTLIGRRSPQRRLPSATRHPCPGHHRRGVCTLEGNGEAHLITAVWSASGALEC